MRLGAGCLRPQTGSSVIVGITAGLLLAACGRKAPASNAKKILNYQSPMRPWVKSDKAGKFNVCGTELVSAYRGAQPVQARMDIVILPRGAAAKSARCR